MSDSFSIVTHKESVNGWHLHMMGGEYWSSMTDQERCAVIAAVPEMLEALLSVDAMADTLPENFEAPLQFWRTIEAARAALAKAEATK